MASSLVSSKVKLGKSKTKGVKWLARVVRENEIECKEKGGWLVGSLDKKVQKGGSTNRKFR